MGTQTSKLSLYKPAVDEEDWGENVNANFDTLDNALVTFHKNVTITDQTLNVTSAHEVIGIDLGNEESFNLNLPAAETVEGQPLFIFIWQDGEGSSVTLHLYSGDQFYGHAGDISASSLGDSIILISDGIDSWYIFANNGFS